MLHCDVLMVDDNEKPVMGGPQVFLVLPRVGEEVVAKFRDSSYVCRVDSIRHIALESLGSEPSPSVTLFVKRI